MKTVILCGGRGTRAHPHTLEVPKPLIEVGDRPVLRHVMDVYAGQGFRSFVLAAGFKADMVAAFASGLPAEWEVEVVDTGEGTGTAARLVAVRDRLGDRFCATYGDGLADADLAALAAFHEAHPGAATVTTVPLPSPFGTVESGPDGRVSRFTEKPVLDDRWINGGFFVLDQRALDGAGDDLERDVLPALAAAGELYAFRHTGFWRSLDTWKDALELAALCADGRPPWTRSATHAPS